MNLRIQNNYNNFKSHSFEDTVQFAAQLSQKFKGGEILFLHGDLGCGKTSFTKGLAEGLGITDLITSPSFTLINFYEGEKLSLCHCDFYRIESADEFFGLGVEDYMTSDNVMVLEWGQKFMDHFPYPFMVVDISILNDTDRNIHVAIKK